MSLWFHLEPWKVWDKSHVSFDSSQSLHFYFHNFEKLLSRHFSNSSALSWNSDRRFFEWVNPQKRRLFCNSVEPVTLHNIEQVAVRPSDAGHSILSPKTMITPQFLLDKLHNRIERLKKNVTGRRFWQILHAFSAKNELKFQLWNSPTALTLLPRSPYSNYSGHN